MGWWGVSWGLGGGNSVGCPPISRFGTTEQRQRWLPGVARGELRFCLGITEPDAGSDVANIQTTAKREGHHWVVNGAKKWITNGIWCDFCTAAVRTGGPHHGGISLLVVPLKVKGATTRRRYNTGVHASGMRFAIPGLLRPPFFTHQVSHTGSTYVTFEDVYVPLDHIIGPVNGGFALLMSNFNSERLSLATAALRLARVCAEDSYNYACKRHTFGKPLIQHPGIRSKIASFGLLIEPAHAFLEQLTYIIEDARVSGREVNVDGMTALLKVMSTRALEKVCREAQQIMGGAGYNKSRKGARIEQISRDVMVHVVGGGS
jgi:alkylation response protein AidB-like acyl-CoA dehydrogenase